jgi:DNA repair protein RadD
VPIPILRPYQELDVASIREAMRQWRRVLYVSPTGSGKTICFSFILYHATIKGSSVVVVAHIQEIVDQIARVLDAMGLEYGRIQPGFPMTDHKIQLGMVQSVARRLSAVREPDLLVIDEAHHAVCGTYARIAAAWHRARVLGVSATPERLDGVGLREAFDWMVIGLSVRELIDQGYLAGFTYLAPATKIDMSHVRSLGGDYHKGDLADAVDQRGVTGDVIAHYRAHLDGRTAIGFTITIAHAEHVAAQFSDVGIAAASIDGTMGRDERRALVDRLRCGDLKVLTSCQIISEGFDAPAVNGALLLRPTQSFALYRQQIGRCLRPKPDGSKAIILDHVGNVERFGLPDAHHEWSLDSQKRTLAEKRELADFRKCKACDVVFPRGATINEVCPDPTTDGCIFAPKILVERPGTLQEVVPYRPDDRFPAWARGLDIKTAQGWQWYVLMDRAAGDPARLQQIQQARGYKRGWVRYAAQDAAAKRQAGQ